MDLQSSAIAAGDGCAANNGEVSSPPEQKTEVSSSFHAMSNGSRDYRFMKNGKPRPSAIRDFPAKIVPANQISDVSRGKQIREDSIVPAIETHAELSADEEKGSSRKSRPDEKPVKALILSSKKTQAESNKQVLASPDIVKSIKTKDAAIEKTQKMPTKPADKKASAIFSSVSDRAEAETNKEKSASLERTLKTPTKAGKSIEKKASANASTGSHASSQKDEAKTSKGKEVSTEKTQKMPTKLSKSVVRKPSGIESTVLDDSRKEVEGAPNEDKSAQAEKIQKMPTALGKSGEKKANDIASIEPDVLQGADQESMHTSQSVLEAMDVDKENNKEEQRAEIVQDKPKGEKLQEETKGEKIKKLPPVKRKAGIRDLPEIAKQRKEKVGMESVQDHLMQDLDMKTGAQEKSAVDIAKHNIENKKKRVRESPDPGDRSKKVLKSKPLDVAETAKESSSSVVTPKARKPAKKSSTSVESGKKVKRSVGKSPKPTAMTDVGDARKFVLESLTLFDAMRRKFVQDEEITGKTRGVRADLQAATLLKDCNASRGAEKAHGSLPGIFVGDIFPFRTELSFARVHGPIQAGIEYLTAKESEYNTPVAISIISNVGQDGEDNGEELIYTGQGGRSADNKQIADQKLERGNLALDGGRTYNVPVRVIRGIKDVNSPSGKIYVYDGLYSVEETFTVKGSGGFDEFKFRLKRLPGQPVLGSDMISLANDLKSQAPSSRKDIVVQDIAKGKENQPICVENTVDDDKGPAPFEYSTKVIYPDSMEKLEPSVGCRCRGVCSLSSNCSCVSENGGELPYLNGGILVRQKDYIFECGSKCSCSSSCRNRATGKGLKVRLDVFKTADRGWGVRSLDMMPAGSFVCEYIGKLVAEKEEMKAVSDREHMLFTKWLLDTPRWGDVPSILPDRSPSTIRPDLENPELIIDASTVGNVARFINHSCSPNLLIQKVLSEHQDVRYPQFKLFAADNILPLRELTFDYGHPPEQEASGQVSMDCLCGSTDCRGKLYL